MMANFTTQPFMCFEFTDQTGNLTTHHFADPLQILVARRVDEVRPVLRDIEQAVASGLYAAGYLSYEAAPAFHPHFSVHKHAKMPLAWFALFREPSPGHPDADGGDRYTISAWRQTTSEDMYSTSFSKLKAAMATQRIGQVNYTMRLSAQFSGNDFAFYRHLTKAQQADYAAYLNLGRFRILSVSPELFFHWDGKRIVTKPMKGTVARGRFLAEDRDRAKWLRHSKKNRAENEMITDLFCDELERVAVAGTVAVPERFKIRRYPTVWQMTSTVEAMTRPGTTLEDVLTALFPSGSITGVPKVDAMALIALMEEEPREVYCGAIGFMTPNREAVFNVPIRTVWIDAETGVAEYSVGGGITSRSTAEDEFREALTKAALLKKVAAPHANFHLVETMRLEKGEYALLSRHLARLQSSAEYFAIPLSIERVKRELSQVAERYPQGPRRVRLLVSQSGDISVESTPLPSLPAAPLPVAVSDEPISSQNRFLYHKTTRREWFESRRSAHPEAFDVLLSNEKAELTEFTIGNVVMELDEQLWTPPITSGLLAGTFRAELLARGILQERVLTRDDLEKCTRLWLINSVRGWVPVFIDDTVSM